MTFNIFTDCCFTKFNIIYKKYLIRRFIMPGLFFVVFLIVIAIISCVKIVPQTESYVVERLGKFHAVWDAGLHLLAPFGIDRIVARASTKEKVLDTPPQSVITSDNVPLTIDAVVYHKTFEPKLYAYGAANPIEALANLTTTALRNIVGELTLDESLTSRDSINAKMTASLDAATDEWGIRVTRVEIRNITPSADIRESMEKQMKAERARRETLLEAEGHKQAVITRAEGDKQAMILAAEGERDARIARAEGEAKAVLLQKQAEADGLRALMAAHPSAEIIELKRYEALVEMANGTASKLIVPTDTVEMVKRNAVFTETTGLGDVTEEARKIPAPAKKDVCCK
jgi:regulator of protease activity HflC (stomatin/prohibitin superfamily)